MCVSFQASCVEQLAVHNILAPGFSAHIHSVYKKVINIKAHDNKMYCIAANSMDNAPAVIKVYTPHDVDFRQVAFAGDAVIFVHKYNFQPNAPVVVNMENAKTWVCELPAFQKNTEILKKNIAELQKVIAIYGKSGGIKSSEPSASKYPMTFQRFLEQRVKELVVSLQNNDFAQAVDFGLKVLGLGCGQTPAGDDFLCGLITVFNMDKTPFGAEFKQFGHIIAGEAFKKTTAVSQVMLNNAAFGLSREHVINLLEVLQQEVPTEKIAEAAKKVLAIGSTSGTDLAVGLVAGLDLGVSRLTNFI